jgi:hypothetical protein
LIGLKNARKRLRLERLTPTIQRFLEGMASQKENRFDTHPESVTLSPQSMKVLRVIPMVVAAALVMAGATSSAAADPPIDFNRDIRPILSDNCFACHGPDEAQRKSGLRLDSHQTATAPARSGARPIVPGHPDQSEVVRRITAAGSDDRMPPPESNKSLTLQEITMLTQWIAQGAEFREHWAFVPLRRPEIPDEPSLGSAHPIDAFIGARLRMENLELAPEADRATLIRRATLDLTGLPPTPDELDAFLADAAPEAYERMVDRLLDSPRFGERMAVEWLDAARYADTHGYHLDSGRDMTAWRDWVINAFNENKPFDQFTIEQLAGDLLPNATREQKIATGFNRNHMINYEGGAIPEEYHYAYLVDRVNTTATVWLGLTMACAQCHDHKYDPISQVEYYQFLAFFNNVAEKGLDGNRGNAAPILKLGTPEQNERLGELNEALRLAEARLEDALPSIDATQAEWEAAFPAGPPPEGSSPIPPPIHSLLDKSAEERSPAEQGRIRTFYREQISARYKELQKEVTERRQQRDEFDASIPSTMVMAERETPRETHVHVRGQYDKLGKLVTPGTPAALPPLPADQPANRLTLARWLVSPKHPLPARVTVNRYWQMYFGTGLVETAEDFGSQAAWPTHPELLDWLACEFVESGWDIKHIQRLILTSATYRQSSRVPREAYERDPDNRLLARGPRLRLQAEFIRDQALALSGLLNGRIGGESVFPYQPAGLWTELSMREDSARFSAQFFVQSTGADLYRRSMYTFWKRSSPPPQLYTFDAPDRETCTVRRPRTSTPLQALILLNDPTYVEASRKLAERLMARAGSDAERVAWAFRLATARFPSVEEHTVLLRVLHEQRAHYQERPEAAQALLSNGDSPTNFTLDPVELAAWTMLSSTLLNLDETITKG